MVGALLLWLLPRVIDGTAGTLRRRPWASLGVGLLGIVGFFVAFLAIILVFILLAVGLGFIRLESLVGIALFGGGALLVTLSFLFFLAAGFVAQAIVGMSLVRLGMGEGPARRWLALVVGALVVAVLISLPVVGGWFGIVIAAFGPGSADPGVLAVAQRASPPDRRRAVGAARTPLSASRNPR